MNVTRKLLTKCHNYDIILGTGVGTVSGPLKYVLKEDVCDLGCQLLFCNYIDL